MRSVAPRYDLFIPNGYGLDLKFQTAGLALALARSIAIVQVIAVTFRASDSFTLGILFAFLH